MRTIINILLFTLIIISNIIAQTSNDTIDTKQIDTAKFIMKKSPTGAVIRSALIPGLGQFYNKSYWKIPIIWGALIYFGYNWSNQYQEYKNYRDLYNQSITVSNPYGNLDYKNLREYYRDQRDITIFFFSLTYLLNIIDAYVDAHLFDFDISPSLLNNKINISLRINF